MEGQLKPKLKFHYLYRFVILPWKALFMMVVWSDNFEFMSFNVKFIIEFLMISISLTAFFLLFTKFKARFTLVVLSIWPMALWYLYGIFLVGRVGGDVSNFGYGLISSLLLNIPVTIYYLKRKSYFTNSGIERQSGFIIEEN